MFTVATPDAEIAYGRARLAILDNGGEMTGDSYSGTFAGNGIEGKYERVDGGFGVTITNKPLGVPCPFIRAKVRGFFR